MKEKSEKSVDELLSLSRVEFMKNFEEIISDEFKEFEEMTDEQANIYLAEEDDSMLYAYNEQLPYIF